MALEPRTCKVCNALFMPTSGSQKCCTNECSAISKKASRDAWNYRRKAKRLGLPYEEPKKRGPAAGMRVKEPYKLRMQRDYEERVKAKNEEMAAFNREARSHGLSYGQYESKKWFEEHYKDSIEYMLKNRKEALL